MPVSPVLSEARHQLDRFLVRAESRGVLDPAKIADIRRDWSGTVNSLPVNPEDLLSEITDAAIHAALLTVLVIAQGKRSQKQGLAEMQEVIAAWRLRQLLDAHEKVQDRYEERSKRFAAFLLVGLLSLRAWHLAQRYHVAQHLLQQVLLARRGNLPDMERERLQLLLQREFRYLDRFVDQVMARRLEDDPYSEDYVVNRAQVYAGTGRGEFYRLLEQQDDLFAHLQPVAALAGRPGDRFPDYGLVAEYIARDDEATCRPCRQAQGFYLLGRGPMPGQICLGRARCRCRRVIRYLPEIYRQLV